MKSLYRAALAAAVALAPLTAAAQTKKITVGMLELPSNGAIYIADAKGYFKAEGLDVSYKYFQAAAAVPTAVVSGDADVGATGVTAALFNLGAKGGFKLFAGVMSDVPKAKNNAFLVSKKAYDAGFKTPQDMRGKKIGIATAGSSHHFYVGMLAKKYGIPRDQIEMVPLQSLDNIYAAITSGNVDGSFPGWLAGERLELAGNAKIIASTGDLIQWQVTTLFANPKKIADDRETVAAFVRAYQKAAKEFNAAFNTYDDKGNVVKGPGYDELLGLIAKGLRQDPAIVAKSLPYIDPETKLDVKSLKEQLKFWQDENVVAKDVALESMIDTSFVKIVQ